MAEKNLAEVKCLKKTVVSKQVVSIDNNQSECKKTASFKYELLSLMITGQDANTVYE